MVSPTPLPTFFGRLTTVLSEHEHLGETLAELEVMSDALEIGRLPLPETLQPPRLLAQLAAELQAHFAAEESDTHFGAVVHDRPALLPRVVDLKADHADMLRHIATLALVAGDEGRWPELVAPLRHLVRKLRAHERAEAALLKEFFAPPEAH